MGGAAIGLRPEDFNLKTLHTQRTLNKLKQAGYMTAIVEKFNYHARRGGGGYGIRQDLFGFIDIIALDTEGGSIIGVQSTGAGFAEHKRKIIEDRREEAINWLLAGGRIQLWGWRKLKAKRGGKKMVWSERVEELGISDFVEF